MVKQIVRDVFFLGQPSEPATKADIQVGKDFFVIQRIDNGLAVIAVFNADCRKSGA